MVLKKETLKRTIVISVSLLPLIMFLSFKVRVFIMHYIGMLPIWILRLNFSLMKIGLFLFNSALILGVVALIGIVILALSCIFGISKAKVRWIARFWAIAFGCLCAAFASWDITYPDGEKLVKALVHGGDGFEYTPAMFSVYSKLWPIYLITGIVLGYFLIWFLYRIGECMFFYSISYKKQDNISIKEKDNST